MSTKTIMMAVAAAMGLAASAGVMEVKFSVKTEVDGKVAYKKISGLYDTETKQHVFWTTQKIDRKNVNVPYEGTYFGLVNDTEAGKKVGQNAELIWGEGETPANVLVAGAWGTGASKSGNAAGTLDGKPATGTWSAKIVKNKKYADLLKKYNVAQTENRTQGVIADLNDAVAQGNADVAAAKEEAARLVKDAEDKAAEMVAKAQEESAAAVAAAKEEADKLVAAAQEEAAKMIADAEAQAQAAIKEAQEKFDADLAAKQAELDQAVAEAETLKGMFKDIDDPDMPNMFRDYLKKTRADAEGLLADATNTVAAAEAAYAAYAESLDLLALTNAAQAATAAYTDATNAVAAAEAARDKLVKDRAMIARIDAGELDDYYTAENGLITLKAEEINVCSNALEILKTTGFEAWTNNQETVVIPGLKAALTNAAEAVTAKDQALKDAQKTLDEAKAKQEAYVEPTYENGGMMNFDGWVASERARLGDTAFEATYPGEVAQHEGYEAYKKGVIAGVKDPLDQAVKDAENALKIAEGDYKDACAALEEAKAKLKKAEDELATAIATGKTPAIEDKEKELEGLKAEKAQLEADYKYWKELKYSDQDKDDLDKAIGEANDLVTAKEADAATAKQAMDDANDALNNAVATQAARLAALSAAIGGETLVDASGNALPLVTIREKVDVFEKKYIDYENAARAQIKAVDDIAANLKLDLGL